MSSSTFASFPSAWVFQSQNTSPLASASSTGPACAIRCTPTAQTLKASGDQVFAAVKRCHEVVHQMGAPRISTSLKVGTRCDRDQTMQDKIDSVNSKLKGEPPPVSTT